MVNRRQLLKISALGTASFAAPLAYSASNITMAYNTGNAIGSTSPKDLSDNARNLDYLVNGGDASYLDRKGVPRKSWKGMEAEHNVDQVRRESEFDAGQTDRDAQFNVFMDASGYEPPVPYAPGITLARITQTVTYLGNEYRVKSQFLPLTITNWATDESKLKLIGDDSLRQVLADPTKGALEVAWQRTKVADAVTNVGHWLSVQPMTVWEKPFISKIISRPVLADPETWDWTPAFAEMKAYLDEQGGGALDIPDGVYRVSKEFFLSSNTEYRCRGTILLTGATQDGAVLPAYGVKNVRWVGGIIDANNIPGQNCIGPAGSETLGKVENVIFSGVTVRNAVWSPTILGGKGFVMHQACRAVRFYDMIVEDCDIGFSVEGFDGRETTGNIIDGVIVRRSKRMGCWLYQGSQTEIDDPSNYSCLIDNAFFEDCTPADGFGVISADRANAIQLKAFINNRNTDQVIIPFKGTMVNSSVDLDINAKNISDCFDMRPLAGGLPTGDSFNVDFEARLVVLGASSGYLVHYVPGNNNLDRADIKVIFDGFSGAGLMSNANTAIHFDFMRLSDGFRVHGRDAVAPAFGASRERSISAGDITTGSLRNIDSAGNSLSILQPSNAGWQIDIRDGSGNPVMRSKVPAPSETALLIACNKAGVTGLSTVTVGAADSGGVGFRVLRVPN